jgi:alpha-L-fucosidase
VFEKSGAKYVVLTQSTMRASLSGPSAEADRSWGKPWNSGFVGPKRDLWGDLTNAVRARG